MNEDWIVDRLPTKSDADDKGLVLGQHALLPYSYFRKWYDVRIDQQWRHTEEWHATPTRKFTSITHADGRYLALADDGTAWFNYGDARGWQQLEPLPAQEVK